MSRNEVVSLPSSTTVEKAVLGIILLNPEKISILGQFLRVEDLYQEAHRTILRAMLRLFSNRIPIDIFTLQNALGHDLALVGGSSYLASLVDGLPRSSNLEYHCRIVQEDSRRRQLIRIGEQLQKNARARESSFQIASEASIQLQEINRQGATSPPLRIGEFYEHAVRDLKSISRTGSGRVGFSTGIPGLDRHTTGIREAEYWVIAGRSGQGKSTLLLQSAWANAREGISSFICSAEMTGTQLLMRMLSWETGIPFYKLRDPRWINVLEWSRLETAQEAIDKLPIVVDESSGLTGEQWESRIYAQINEGARIVYFDYLQRIFEPSQRSMYEKITTASSRLREIAKQTKIPLIVVSQLRRPEGSWEAAAPTIHELKESGNIENDAHTVVLIHRPFKGGKYTHEDSIAIGKQRSGASGVFIPVVFSEENLRFMDREKEKDEKY